MEMEFMSKIWKLTKACDGWKKKAKDRGADARALRKELARIKADRDRKQKSIVQLKEELKSERSKMSTSRTNKVALVYMVLTLFLVGRIGFRAISRVLSVLGPSLGLQKTPCAQTISNYIFRLSIAKTQAVFEKTGRLTKNFTSESIWMLDLSIGLGAGKILSVLSLNLKHHQQIDHAPTLQN